MATLTGRADGFTLDRAFCCRRAQEVASAALRVLSWVPGRVEATHHPKGGDDETSPESCPSRRGRGRVWAVIGLELRRQRQSIVATIRGTTVRTSSLRRRWLAGLLT